MNTYAFSTDNEDVIRRADKEFDVAVVFGSPESGYSSGYDIEIYDSRPEEEIHNKIKEIKHEQKRHSK
jgi:hypothetical protein